MVKMHELKPAPGAKRARRRVGRGHGSGLVKTAGRGSKGQKARAGGGVHPRFEGGQLPLIQRLPHKRGFTNLSRVEYQVVNLAKLSAFAVGTEVGPVEMARAGIIKSAIRPVKVLGQGEIDRALKVSAHRFSESATAKIEAAGGTVTALEEREEASPEVAAATGE